MKNEAIKKKTQIKKPMASRIENVDYEFSEKDVFVHTINGKSNVEGKNYVLIDSLSYVTVVPNDGYDKFRIERRYYEVLEEDISGEFEKIELENGKIVRGINLEFYNLKDSTYIYIYCLKNYDDFLVEKDKYWDNLEDNCNFFLKNKKI